MRHYLNNLVGIRPRNQLYISALLPPIAHELTAGEAAGTAVVAADYTAGAANAAIAAANRGDVMAKTAAIFRAIDMALKVARATRMVEAIATAEGVHNIVHARITASEVERHVHNHNVMLDEILAMSPEQTAREVVKLAMSTLDASRQARLLANRIEEARMARERL